MKHHRRPKSKPMPIANQTSIHERLIIDGEKTVVTRGDRALIKKLQLHSIKATTKLTIIETKIGDVLSENDIERTPCTW